MLTSTNHLNKLALLLTAFFLSNPTQAQLKETENFDQGFRLGFGINSGYAFQEPYHFSYGADLRIQYDLSERFSITLTSGYTNITISGNDNDLAFIPQKLVIKHLFGIINFTQWEKLAPPSEQPMRIAKLQ